MAAIILTVADFRARFTPQFDNTTTYPSVMIQAQLDIAPVYVNNQIGAGSCCCGYTALNTAQQTQALYLMAAHLVFLNALIAAGQTPGTVTQAAVDKVSVSVEPPPNNNNWQYWLNQSPYGTMLLALFSAATAGGFYIGGSYELGAFRRGQRLC